MSAQLTQWGRDGDNVTTGVSAGDTGVENKISFGSRVVLCECLCVCEHVVSERDAVK